MATVVLKDLAKTYPEKRGAGVRVVHGINLEIRSGEFMVLIATVEISEPMGAETQPCQGGFRR